MKNVHPLRAARRKTRRQARLGDENPCCVQLGRVQVNVLKYMKPQATDATAKPMEYFAATVIESITARLLNAGIDMIREEDPRERTSQWMLSNATFLRGLADCWERQAKLIKQLEENREI